MGFTALTEDKSPWFIEERNFLVNISGLYWDSFTWYESPVQEILTCSYKVYIHTIVSFAGLIK